MLRTNMNIASMRIALSLGIKEVTTAAVVSSNLSFESSKVVLLYESILSRKDSTVFVRVSGSGVFIAFLTIQL
ncbi:MAG: hypothetical protein WCK34_01530 [Bacteroidota bacterium]